NTVLLCRRIMEHIGINPERLSIEFMSAGEGNVFTEEVDKFVKSVKELGPLGSSDQIDEDQLKSELDSVAKLIPYIKIVKAEKLATRLENEEEYDGLFTSEEIETLFNEVVSYYIDPEKCKACMICARKCPVEAIDGGKGLIHVIDQDKCIKCNTCFEACPEKFSAVTKIVAEPVPPPLPEDARVLVKEK
ncbi:MAG: 4Fe-4S dicluster domain-containing protein, partial [Planctomycetes bacterium]|nr:4Fe-4S dicluster domain-containing protein [Planctomycetota bacterium]